MAAHKTTHHRATAVNSGQRNKVMLVLVIVALVIVGYFVFRSQAGQPAVALTASKGTVASPAATVTDSTATGGSAVQFLAKQTGGNPFCGNPPTGNKIDTVIVIAEENRTWGDVGGPTFDPSAMPYLHSMAAQCYNFNPMNEAEPNPQNSATQYVAAWTGFGSSVTHVNQDCAPSASCSYTGNNIFRVMRAAGIPHREYVETTSTGTCNSTTAGNAPKHIPDLYMFDPNDKAACPNEVLPLTQMNWANPPTGFTFITPNLDNDGHNAGNSTVDGWLKNSSRLPALFNSPQYKAGKVLIEIWWDEDRPKPNLFVCWTCKHGTGTNNPGWNAESLLWLNLVNSPAANLGAISTATDIRPQLGTP